MILEFEPGDLELVASTPQSPCASCSFHDYCRVVCQRQWEWDHVYGYRLRERGLENVAQKYWRYLAAVKAQQRATVEVQQQRQFLIRAGLEGLLKPNDQSGASSERPTPSFV